MKIALKWRIHVVEDTNNTISPELNGICLDAPDDIFVQQKERCAWKMCSSQGKIILKESKLMFSFPVYIFLQHQTRDI